MTNWNCVKCNIDVRSNYCPKCNTNEKGHKRFLSKTMESVLPATGYQRTRVDDWHCNACDINIYGGKRFCIKCHKDKDGNEQPRDNSGNHSYGRGIYNNQGGRGMGRGGRGRGFGRGRGDSVNDSQPRTWQCRLCRVRNSTKYAYCPECIPCDEKWSCIKCKKLNPKSDPYCGLCGININGRDKADTKVFGEYTKEDEEHDFGVGIVPKNITKHIENSKKCEGCGRGISNIIASLCFACITNRAKDLPPPPPIKKEEHVVKNNPNRVPNHWDESDSDDIIIGKSIGAIIINHDADAEICEPWE